MVDADAASRALSVARVSDALEALMDRVEDGILAGTAAGRLAYVNSSAAASFGFASPSAMYATHPDDLLSRVEFFFEDGTPVPPEYLIRGVTAPGNEDAQQTLRSRDRATGEERWFAARSHAVHDERGTLTYGVTSLRDVTEVRRNQTAQRLLVEAGRILERSFDFADRLENVTRLAVPLLADWCAVDVLDADHSIRPSGLAHADPSKADLAQEWRELRLAGPDASHGVAHVIGTGESELTPVVTEDLSALDDSPEILAAICQLQPRSMMIVPLKGRARVFGAATFVWSETPRHYDQVDLALAEEVGRRVGLALDHALLYEESLAATKDLEARVDRRTEQLRALNARLQEEVAERVRVGESLRVVLDAAPDAMVIADENGSIVQINPQTERLFGYSAAELIGRKVEVLLPRRHQYSHRRHRATFMAEPKRRSMGPGLDLWGRRKDGSEFPVEISLSPLDTPSGQQVVSAIRDISARKRALDDLAETRRRLVGAREAERVRLAQELHDGPTQSLYGLSFRLAGLADLGGDAALRELGSLQDSLHDATSQLHAVCTSLRPPALVAFGLEPAIRSALDGLMSAHPELAVSVRLARDDNVLRNEVRLALYRIFQEAIANLVRHANAGAVAVTLELDAEAVSIDVADDGAGFVVPERWVEFAREGHLGLVGAAERAEAVGGRLIVTSRPGYGTRVHAVVPLGEDGLLPGAPSRTGS